MRRFRRTLGPVIAINGKFLGAALFGWPSWLLWPTSIDWWGFAPLAMICMMAAAASLVGAFKAMAALYERDKTLAEFEAMGGKPKSSGTVDHDDLTGHGMR